MISSYIGNSLRKGKLLAQSFSVGKPKQMEHFKPEEHGLDESFVLTNYTKMKG